MPLYSYLCADCGEELELLHGMTESRSSCGLDCKRRDSGAFGKGSVRRLVTAANLGRTGKGGDVSAEQLIRDTMSMNPTQREALRDAARARMGGGLTEGDLDKLRDGGMAVYRNQGDGTMKRTGGDAELPDTLNTTKS